MARRFLAMFLTVSIMCASERGNAASPNFVIIMADDMGYGDAGCYGGTAFPTPNIDRLATEGLRFTDFHSSGCVCSPTRAGLLTGRYQRRAGISGVIYAAFEKNRHHGLQLSETTLAEVLQQAGYATGIFGKWHLGYQEQYNPIHQGFDRYVGYVSGNVDFHTHIDGAGVFDWWHQNQKTSEDGYTTHLITQHACRFIQDSAAAGRPFCTYIAHETPHDPYQGPSDPPVRREGETQLLYNHREPEHARRAYADMMRELDRGVGAVLQTLEDSDVDNETLVLFFSDNGATGPGSCGGLYGMKGTLWEGGHRVPGLARWPGTISPGSVTDQLTSTIDIMPTILDLSGTSPPSGLKLDGRSLRSVLLDGAELPSRKMFWEYRQMAAMRDGHWKLVVNGGKLAIGRRAALFPNIEFERPDDGRHQVALFNLADDPQERVNLAGQHQARVAAMQAEIEAWREDVREHASVQPDTAP